MGQSAEGITVDMLQQVSHWWLREETLKAANAALVNYHHRLDFSAVWGEARLLRPMGNALASKPIRCWQRSIPRYFGYYDRAVTVYTHMSDQYSVYGTQAISCAPREALYVLDGLLENDTVLRIREHYTDTHGYTEHIFGLCYLLGYAFMPRIRDLKDQQLYKIERGKSYGCLDPLFRGGMDERVDSGAVGCVGAGGCFVGGGPPPHTCWSTAWPGVARRPLGEGPDGARPGGEDDLHSALPA